MQKTNSLSNRPMKNNIIISFLCYLIPFVCLGGTLLKYMMSGRLPGATGYYIIHYLYTYDHGFIGRGLVGEIISWFFDTVSYDLTQKIITIFSTFLVAAVALCIGKSLNRVKDNPKHFFIVSVICFVICILPGSIEYYLFDLKLDKLVWTLTLFAAFISDKKYLVWLIPFICVTATLVNPVFLFCGMILISIILLQEFVSHGFSKKHGAICLISYGSMIAIGLYSTLSQRYLGFSEPSEMIDFYFSRYEGILEPEIYRLFETEWLFDYFDSIDIVIEKAFKIYCIKWGNWNNCIVDFIFLMIPTYFISATFWKACMKESKNKIQKLVFFFCMISPIVTIPPIVLSWESSKYFYNNVFVQLSLVVYFIVRNNSYVLNIIDKALSWMKSHKVASTCLLLYYLSFITNR